MKSVAEVADAIKQAAAKKEEDEEEKEAQARAPRTRPRDAEVRHVACGRNSKTRVPLKAVDNADNSAYLFAPERFCE